MAVVVEDIKREMIFVIMAINLVNHAINRVDFIELIMMILETAGVIAQ